MKKTRLLARCAILTALSVTLLYLAGVLPAASLTLAAFAAVLPAAAVLQGGLRWGAMVWLASSALGLLLAPDKSMALLYALVLGHYTITKSLIERIGCLPAEWALKLLTFNLLLAGYRLLFGSFFEQSTDGIRVGTAALWLILNILFVLYDIGCTGLIATYLRRFGKRSD